MGAVTLDYLIQDVRVEIGDYLEPYRYLDEWVLKALNISAKKFQRYNRSKYLINDHEALYRNTSNSLMFTTEEATEGVIEKRDEPILTTLAAIIMLEGSLENSAYTVSNWRDAEISFSNVESGRLRNDNLKRLIDQLDKMILPPMKRLASSDKQSLPGYLGNPQEHEGDY